MRRHGVQSRAPTYRVEGIGQVQLDPRVLGPLRRDRLHGVHQYLRAAGPTGAKLVLAYCLLERMPVLPHQAPRRQLAQALPAGDGTDPAVVLQQRRQLGEPQQVRRALREVAVCDPVAEVPQSAQGPWVALEGLEVRKARPGRPWS